MRGGGERDRLRGGVGKRERRVREETEGEIEGGSQREGGSREMPEGRRERTREEKEREGGREMPEGRGERDDESDGERERGRGKKKMVGVRE